MIHIAIAGEKIFEIAGLTITNSILTTWVVMTLLILAAFFLRSQVALVPSKLLLVGEMLVGGIYSLFESVLGEHTKKFFPLVATLFIFILFNNWFGLLPGVGSIGLHEIEHGQEKFIPLFRAATADLNTTIALAIIAVASLQYYGVRALGAFGYIGKFISFKDPISFFVGLLETVSEFSKIISFAFRLFGNIFAGEVLLTVIAFLIPVLAPIPFLGLEIFVGFIQALVFAILTAVFLSVATAKAAH